MQAGPDAYAIIKHYEALRLNSYLDPKGFPTIGYGHRGADVEHPMRITREEALRLLSEDVYYCENQLNRMITRKPVAQNHFDALLSFAFNVGCGRVLKSKILKMFNTSQDAEAANEFLRWNNVKINGRAVKYRGLTYRRNSERELFLKGVLNIKPNL
jgi:lysozyme